jgi:hypothetical protein
MTCNKLRNSIKTKPNRNETKMALQAKLYGHDAALSLSLHFQPPRVPLLPFQSRGGGVSFDFHSFKPQRLLRVVLAMAVKRSPKRLKYSSPRFTKEDGLLYVEADSSGADSWRLEPVIDLLKQGAVGVIPTDTLYAIVCDLKSHSAIERLRRIKNIEPSKPLSILCHSFRDIDKYTTGFPCGDGQGHANIFRAVKHCLPGPVSMLSGSRGYSGGNIRYPLVPSLSNSYKVTCKIKRVESGTTIHWYT